MSAYDHLTPFEEIVARAGPFYATTHRVLRWERAPNGRETVAELPYGRLRSVELVRPGNHRMMAGGVLLVLAGLFLGVYVGLYTPFLAVPLGLGLIIAGGRGKPRYYQLHSHGETLKDQTQWRVPYTGSMQFMAALGDRTGRGPIE